MYVYIYMYNECQGGSPKTERPKFVERPKSRESGLESPSEQNLVKLLDAWSRGWKHKGRVRAVGPGAYEKYCTLGLYGHGGIVGISRMSDDEDIARR